MPRITINVPSSVNISVIEGALRQFGAEIIRRTPKAEKVFCEPVVLSSGREIDPLDVAQRIRKLESMRLRMQNNDGRDSYSFPPGYLPLQSYILQFCSSNNLKMEQPSCK